MKKQYIALIIFIAITMALITACGVHTEAAAEKTEEVISESIPEQTTVVETLPVSIQETAAAATTQTEAEESFAEKEQSLSAEEAPSPSNSSFTLEGGNSLGEATSISIASKVYGIVHHSSEAWYSFTTGDTQQIEYCITAINKTLGSGMQFTLYDDNKEEINGTDFRNNSGHRFAVSDSGIAVTGCFDSLTPNTTYYIAVTPASTSTAKEIDFTLFVNSSEQHVVSVLKSAQDESGLVYGGTNQDDSVLLPMATKTYGSVISHNCMWYAFTTDEEPQVEYFVTVINKTLKSGLRMYLYNEQGAEIQNTNSSVRWDASDEGIASTSCFDSLSPNTTYYVLVTQASTSSAEQVDYMLIIRNSTGNAQQGYSTTGNYFESFGTAYTEENEIHPGTNQDDSAFIAFGYTVSGNFVKSTGAWFAFRTEEEEKTYTITALDETPDSWMRIYVYDEFGTEISNFASSYSDGASAAQFDSLHTDTNYYIRLIQGSTSTAESINYQLFVEIPPEPELPEAETEPVEDQPLVFEVPFELDETQVHFVANEAIFIDEEAAKEALAPVAEIILAHPDHPILLAGTTATWGSQESCVDLSNRRAGAVKDLLVNYYGIPEDQLKTIGLGFAADPFVRGQDVDSNGNFIETEGAKNRRTIIMDAEDPIAKELLGE